MPADPHHADEPPAPLPLGYARNYPPIPDTSNLAITAAVLSLIPSPCCLCGLFELQRPAGTFAVAGVRISTEFMLYVFPTLCLALSAVAAIRILRSRGRLIGLPWAIAGACLSLVWITAAALGVGW